LKSLPLVKTEKKSLDSYIDIVGKEKIKEIKDFSSNLKGLRVLHVNSTAYGGGVSEILRTLVPLMRDVGLDAEWRTILGDKRFFNVTKAFHNALQGMDIKLNQEMRDIFLEYNRKNAEKFDGEYDFVVIHDPQPVAIYYYLKTYPGKWIWRCHIDLTNTNITFWNFIKPFVEIYDSYIFTLKNYAQEDLFEEKINIITPSIDPLSEKNDPLEFNESKKIFENYKIDTSRPIILQVSRFDPWKDPLGVIDAYRIVKKQFPDVQLVMAGSMATDDPEGIEYYEKTKSYAGEDPNISLLTNLDGVGDKEINAFQVASDVIVQKSTREGFGLTVTEGLWKGKPVIGGNVGGIPIQIINGENGFLVNNINECAEKIIFLLKNPEISRKMGKKAKECVRNNFLITEHLYNYLKLFKNLLKTN
jgi:trehalose synthase